MAVALISLCLLYVVEVNSINNKIDALLPVHFNQKSPTEDVPIFGSNEKVSFYIFGENLTSDFNVGISKHESCRYVEPVKFVVKPDSNGHIGLINFIVPSNNNLFTKTQFYICVMQHEVGTWVSQGISEMDSFFVYQSLLTPFLSVIIIILCFTLSSLMSGLNLGLMSLDPNELLLLKNAGTRKEKKYAKKILPIRKNGNFLLCTIVITGTLCNAVSTISIDNLISDTVAIIVSTIVIVLFCEILPQSICTYYPLEIGFHTVYITMASMLLTAPISYPLGKVFDLILRKEMTAKYSKARLKEMLKLTELPANEEKIISGTLDLSHKKVEDVMTSLDDVFTLPITAVVDLETIISILSSGYSRIPIYSGKKSNICYVLLTKDLALIDPNDSVEVKALLLNSKNTCNYIPVGTTVDKALLLFKESRKQMAFVVDSPITDKDKRVIGLITFEDVIEEIFQTEIIDETDNVTDNRFRKSITNENGLVSYLAKHSVKPVTPSDSFKLATYHFLSGIEIFSAEYISPRVLARLLDLDIFYSALGHVPQDCLELYVKGVSADYFIMVLEGHLEVKFGSEELKFKAGPFRYFGVESLIQGPVVSESHQDFTPDYTLQAVKNSMYMKISKVLYDAAVLATKYERFKILPNINTESDLYIYFKQLSGQDFLDDTKSDDTGVSNQN